jgi:hypothetical protein
MKEVDQKSCTKMDAPFSRVMNNLEYLPVICSLHTSMSFLTIAGWMLRIVGLKFAEGLLILLLSERGIVLSIFPSVSPAIPGEERGMSSRADAVVHQVCQGLTAGALEHAIPQHFVGMLAILLCTSAPIGDIMGQAAIAPQSPVFDVAIREKAASVAREVMEISGRGGSYGE